MSIAQRVQSQPDDCSIHRLNGRNNRGGWVCRAPLAVAALIALSSCQGITHRQQREQAEQHWGQVRARVKLQLATQQYEVGQIEAAVTTVREAIGLDPTSVASYLLLSRALLEQGDLPGAGRVLAAAEGPGLEVAELCYMRGVIAERSRRLVEALADFERAARLDPDQKDYLVARAECLVAVGRPEEACALVVESADRFDRDGTLDTLLAEILLLLHDEAGAAAAFRRALPLVDDNELVVEQYGLLLTRLNRPAEAIAVLQPLVADRPEQPGREVIRALAACYLDVGQSAAAAELLRGWLTDHADDHVAWLLRARASMALGDTVGARRCVEAARRLAPRDPQTALAHGYVAWKLGDTEQAYRSLERTLALDADNVLAHCLMGEVLVTRRETRRARHHWRRALQIDPESRWARRGLDALEPGRSG